MRLTEQQLERTRQGVSEVISALTVDWQLWLFGSRLNDEAKGGDIDLCLCADMSIERLTQLKWQLRPRLEEALDIPVDLVMQSTQQPIKLVTQQAMQTGVRLI